MTDFNKVDTLVKASMLSYPSIFQSRMDVLAHVLMVNGSGYYFDPESGVVTDGEEVVVPESLTYPDAPKDDAPEATKLRVAYQRHMLAFIEENIDSLCKKNLDSMSRDDVHGLSRTLYSTNGVLANIEKFLDMGNDPEAIDDDWRRAIKEFCTWFKFKCTSEDYVSVNDEGESPKCKDSFILVSYSMCERLFKKCQTKKDHDLMAKRSSIAKDIVERMLQKEKGRNNGE